jgi:hypothetical protein
MRFFVRGCSDHRATKKRLSAVIRTVMPLPQSFQAEAITILLFEWPQMKNYSPKYRKGSDSRGSTSRYPVCPRNSETNNRWCRSKMVAGVLVVC